MIRLQIFFVFFIFIIGIVLFQSKHKVLVIERQNKILNKKIKDHKNQIAILKAEISFLNNPARLEKLVKTHLKTNLINSKQYIKMSDIGKITGDKVEPISNKNISKTTDELDSIIAQINNDKKI